MFSRRSPPPEARAASALRLWGLHLGGYADLQRVDLRSGVGCSLAGWGRGRQIAISSSPLIKPTGIFRKDRSRLGFGMIALQLARRILDAVAHQAAPSLSSTTSPR